MGVFLAIDNGDLSAYRPRHARPSRTPRQLAAAALARVFSRLRPPAALPLITGGGIRPCLIRQ